MYSCAFTYLANTEQKQHLNDLNIYFKCLVNSIIQMHLMKIIRLYLTYCCSRLGGYCRVHYFSSFAGNQAWTE